MIGSTTENFDHKTRHQQLHSKLDELVADFISVTGNLPSKTTLMEFMEWSFEQTIYPTTKKDQLDDRISKHKENQQ